MLLFPLALILGVVLGWLRGGRLQSLGGIRLRAAWLVCVAVGIQAAIGPSSSTGVSRPIAVLVSYGMIGIWLLLMLRDGPLLWRCGFAWVAVGYALNLAAIVPNGSMPVSVAALRGAGGSTHAFHDPRNLPKHVVAGDHTVWAWLGDVVPVRALGVVLSVGDIALLIGVVIILYAGMTSAVPVSSDRRTGTPR